MHPNFAGALINSALYLAAVFVAALMTGHRFAWQCAIIAMGVTYLSHVAQFTVAQLGLVTRLANWLVIASMLLGALAGLALLA